MALQGSGQIKLSELATEFGGTAPYSLKAYYRGGGRVPANNTNVPASGAIGLKNFYNAVNRVTLSATIGANTTETSITTSNVPGYIAGATDLTVYVSSGVYVYSTNTANPALTLGTGFAAGDTITLINKGFIMGQGGYGGSYGTWPRLIQYGPQAGGPAISIGYPVTIDNTNASAYIAGGGGGGYGTAPNGGQGGGGAGGGRGAVTYNQSFGQGAAGGAPGQSGADAPSTGGQTGGKGGGAGGGGAASDKTGPTGGGGGGGRILPGVGGPGVFGNFSGGAGGSANNPGATAQTGSGGGGGGWGAAGGSNGAAGGKAVALNGNTVTWVAGNTTRVYGAVS